MKHWRTWVPTLLLLLGSGPIHADGFLSKSRLLRGSGIRIIPAQQTRDGLVLPVADSDRLEAKIFLSSGGVYPIKKSSGRKRKLNVHTCGGDELAFPWKSGRPIQGTGYFVAAGKRLDSLGLKWVAATKVDPGTQQKCFSYEDYKADEVEVASIPTLPEKTFFVSLLSPEGIRWKKLYEREQEKAYELGAPNCDTVFAVQRVGLLPGAGCEILLESKLDCDGQGYGGGSLGKPLGMIEISREGEIERWLVFEASGYEGDAFLGIRLSKGRPAPEADIDFYVYSGC